MRAEEQLARFQQILILLIVAPYAFVLWFWRGQSSQEELHQRELTFHQAEMFRLQEWLVDFSNPGLQIAALYRLRQYLIGTHGVPLMESALQALMYSLRQGDPDPKIGGTALSVEFRKLLYVEPRLLVRVSTHDLFKGMNLSGISLEDMLLTDIRLNNCVMTGASFRNTRFVRAEMIGSDFSNATFAGCSFDDVQALDSNFENAEFSNAKLNHICIRPSNGAIHSKQKIFLGSNAKVEGDLFYAAIELAAGAEIRGKLVNRPSARP